MGPDIGFDTIGNATLICYDKGPLLVTDPWIQGAAYFGSWMLSHEIPPEQTEAVKACPFVWFSHGHPDHLNPECLPLFRDKQILLADHVGGRIAQDLKSQGFKVTVLEDRKWVRLSDRVRVLTIADPLQDSIILVDINGRLVININDTSHGSWTRFVRRTAKQFSKSYLLSLCCYGDVDMIHFLDSNGKRIEPQAAKKEPLGAKIAEATEWFGANYFIPFSSMHRYQREDSIWVNQYGLDLADFEKGFHSKTSRLLPAFLRVDCTNDQTTEIKPREMPAQTKKATEFGDHWSDVLEKEDQLLAKLYFQGVEELHHTLDRITLRVGGKDFQIDLSKERKGRSVTFEAPRNSLMAAIRYEIFDDMMIGNFMKTTLEGDWISGELAPYFVPYLTKYADNGRAKTRADVRHYLNTYEKRSLDNVVDRIESRTKLFAKQHLDTDGLSFRLAKIAYRSLRRLTG